MQADDVASLYRELQDVGVHIWIDGGWSIDAVLGRETRLHADLDIAIEAKDVPALQQHLAQRGFRETRRESDWNVVLADVAGRQIDVHVVVLDEHKGVHGDAKDGIAYPAGSLTGTGVIAGVPVRCIHPDAMLRFKTSYPPRPKDRTDVAILCAHLARPVPDSHTP